MWAVAPFLLCFLHLNRVNVGCGPAEERVLLTGLHAVADIYCECCKTVLGWKYVSLHLKIKFKIKLNLNIAVKVQKEHSWTNKWIHG